MGTTLKEPDFISEMYCISEWDDVDAALKSLKFKGARMLDLPTRSGILGLINGQEHHERRRLQLPVFQRDALSDYERRILQPLLGEFVDRWRRDGHAELVEEGLMLLVRIGALLTGIGEITSNEEAHAVLDDVAMFGAAINVEYSKLPPAGQQQIVDAALATISAFDEKYIRPVMEAREPMVVQVRAGTLDAAELPRDVVTQMMLHWRDEWDRALVTREVLGYMVASVRTSVRAITHSVDEISRWVANHPEDEVRASDPAFVRASVNETLRLHAIVPILMRLTSEDVRLPSGLEIPADSYVAILYVCANRDPQRFGDDADEFDPYRSRRNLPGQDYGFSFAAGEHACIGRRLAVGAGGDPDTANNGTVMTIVEQLMALGASPDPNDPPIPNDKSFIDEFERYPVRVGS